MKFCKKCLKTKSLSDFGNWKDSSDGLRSRCKECNNEESKQWKKYNYSKHIEYNRLWQNSNKELCAQYSKKYASSHLKESAAKTAKRRAAKLQATPKWLTTSDWIEIQWAYDIAASMTRETGVKHEVDHIIPLQGKNVSGLHCPQNLRIITKTENCRKGSRY